MNFFKRYNFYKKLINPGPAVSVKNEDVSTFDFTRIDWTYNDDKNTYQIRSYKLDACPQVKRDYDFYSAIVYLNGREVTVFIGGRKARNLYDKAAAVMLTPIMKKTITARVKSR